MAAHGGPRVTGSNSAKLQIRQSNFTVIRSKNGGRPVSTERVFVDRTSDPTGAWFLVFMAFPRAASPYLASKVGDSPPRPTDTTQTKLADAVIQEILANGIGETRTQWTHTSVEFGSIFADGSLTNSSTQYNLFEYPRNWNSTSQSPGQRFKRKRGLDLNYTDFITSAAGGCSGAVGGWSNFYEQSCVQSWFAGCEGGPALNHRCAGGVADKAEKLIIWAR